MVQSVSQLSSIIPLPVPQKAVISRFITGKSDNLDKFKEIREWNLSRWEQKFCFSEVVA